MRGNKIRLLPVVVAVVLIRASEGFAQSVAGNPSPPQSDATVQQRKSSAEEAPKNASASFTVMRGEAPAPRRIFVRSHSLLVRGAVIEEKLLKRPDFQRLGLVITRDASEADLILELRHDLFTKYVFSVVDAKTQLVLDGGKVRSLGGPWRTKLPSDS